MMSKLRVGSDFSGVGAFDQALKRLGIDYKTVYACDWDKYSRQTYIHNYGEPKYFPQDVYDREIPEESLDIYMTSPPCQAFSLAGKRKGEDDDRGVLFYNSHEFILKNNPRYFIFENVKGLLSDSNGRTFNVWLEHLGGKSVNGNPVIFPMDEAAPYHIYWQVLNAKDYGIPQNRERVFIIGIRDDQDNQFSFPKPFPLEKRLKDVLEPEVDQKYFLSDKMLNYFDTRALKSTEGSGNKPKVIIDEPKIGAIRGRNPENPSDRTTEAPTEQRLEINNQGVSNTLTSVQKDNVVVEKKNYIQWDTSGKGYDSQQDRAYYEDGHMGTIPAGRTENKVNVLLNNYRIRRLTVRECARLMAFPDSFEFPVSDSQGYKQMGNSIVVDVLSELIKKLKL